MGTCPKPCRHDTKRDRHHRILSHRGLHPCFLSLGRSLTPKGRFARNSPNGIRGIPGLVLRRASQAPCALSPPKTVVSPPLPSAVPCVTPHRRTCGWWAESTAARDLEESGFAGLFLVFSQPLHGQVFSAESTQKGPCPPPRGGAACCSCRCSWARWPASVLWEPRAPAAREFWANAQPWHGPLSH